MSFILDSEKKTFFAALSFACALSFTGCMIMLLLQVGSLYTPMTDETQEKGNAETTNLFRKKLEEGNISNVVLSRYKPELIKISFEYEEQEEIPVKKKKKDEPPPEPIFDTVQKKGVFIQQPNFFIDNPKKIPIKEVSFSQYHKNKAFPFGILGALSFFMSAFFAYKRDRVIIDNHY